MRMEFNAVCTLERDCLVQLVKRWLRASYLEMGREKGKAGIQAYHTFCVKDKYSPSKVRPI